MHLCYCPQYHCIWALIIFTLFLQEIGATLQELSIQTPEEMGYDKPELALATVYD